MVVVISQITKTDRNLIGLIVASIIITSFAWIGDIASWIYLGNGFLLDFILLVIAILLTLGTIFLIRHRQNKPITSTQSVKKKEITSTIKSEKKVKSRTSKQTNFTCSSCGELFPVNETHCSSCGSTKPVCIVCLSDLGIEQEVVKLNCCSEYSHKEHIINWLNVKGFCPKCEKEIEKNDWMSVALE